MGTMRRMVLNGAGQDRSAQLLRGVLDICLMSIIDEETSYGYEMVRKLSDRGLDLASEGSIYPLLSRLQKRGLIEGYLVQSSEGPARKYYRMTPKGRKTLKEWRDEWLGFRSSVDAVLNGDNRA
jgi:PadR family transcriptional regulator PadR